MLFVRNLWDIYVKKKIVEKFVVCILGLIDESMNMIDS